MVTKWIERNAQLNIEYQPWRDFYRQVSKVLYPQGGQYLEDGKPALKAKYHSDMISDAGEYAGKIFGRDILTHCYPLSRIISRRR